MRKEVRINLNEIVKFKLTDYGKDIYYHRYDSLNEFMQMCFGKQIDASMPKVDEEGYTEMRLWEFMGIYGPHMGLAKKECIAPLEIIYRKEN